MRPRHVLPRAARVRRWNWAFVAFATPGLLGCQEQPLPVLLGCQELHELWRLRALQCAPPWKYGVRQSSTAVSGAV